MTPKEKALELIDKYSKYVTAWDCYNDAPTNPDFILKDAKQCALICVTQMILFVTNGVYHINPDKLGDREYWEAVERELKEM